MSGRRKPPARRGRRTRLQHEDDMPLSVLALIAPRAAKGKKKQTPFAKMAKATNRTLLAANVDLIDLNDANEAAAMLSNINSKIGNFMKSGSFISSDEDESDMLRVKTNKRSSSNSSIFISDDSDDDCKTVHQLSSNLNLNTPELTSEPSTSAGTSNDNKKYLENDIMMMVDSFLGKTETVNNEAKSPLKDMKSLEDFRKETEEMLKTASSLLDEIKTGRKVDPPDENKEKVENKEEDSKKITLGECPVCFESLVGRSPSVTLCGHIFCKDCIMKTVQTSKKCPTCRKPINSKKIHPIYF